MKETIRLDWHDWEAEFKPLADKHGDEIDFHPKIVNAKQATMLEKAISENRVWTLLDEEELITVEGLRLVNRIAVYITEKSFDKNKNYIVL